jgi:hypothetical protein
MSILLSILLLQAGAAPGDSVQPASLPAATSGTEAKFCREMLMSSSRLGAVKVCKTSAGWQRWERCHSATRYCAPPVQQTVTVASLPDDPLVCKYLKTTGSRIAQEKICATRRQWELTELETQETIRNRQNTSTLTGGSEEMSRSPGGGGPR